MNRIIFILFLLLVGLENVSAQKAYSTQEISNLTEYIRSLESYGNAGQVLFARKGEIVFNKSYGYADREKRRRVEDTTIFELASVSKMFTAVVVLTLEMDNKLAVTDSISKYLSNVPADKKTITIHHLLTHTSGIRGGDLVNDFEDISKEELVKKILGVPLRSKPGVKWMYSNSGYNLLAAIIEKASGKSYEEYLRENLFLPLGMKNSGVNNTEFLKKKSFAIAYQGNKNNNGPDEPRFNPRTWGSGSVCSTVSDLFIWERALRKAKILDETTLKKMFSKHVSIGSDDYSYYGYGCFVYKRSGDSSLIVDHGGDTQRGFNSTFRMFIEDDNTYLFLSNAKQPGGTWDRWFVDSSIKKILQGEKPNLPPAAVQMSPKQLEMYTGTYSNGNARINISTLGNKLVLDAIGQEAVNVLYNFSSRDSIVIKKVNEQLTKILEDYKNKTEVGLREFLSENGIRDFIEERDMLLRNYGSLKKYSIEGAIPDASDPTFWVCTAKLEYENKTVDYFSMWMIDQDNVNLDFATADLSSQINKTFTATGKNRFTTYNFFTDVQKSILFEKDKKGKVKSLSTGKIKFTRELQ